ncbi:hypothetical protein BDZ94DRAFT_1303749 [Collybia nuda]|uniref:EH domain-containing protein n=1 Tax=Collybia nuda TaxID=64659 RepID=A0A9P5YIF4_9AGAR|nr:hypothetical protein BDZ94DRAFT_1303749 [Collybia nuda]
MPSTALQSRISAFESLASPPSSLSSSPSSIRKNVQNTSNNNPTPLSPPMTPRPSTSASPSPSPPNLGRKTSLIDLKDWIVDDGLSPSRPNGLNSHHTNGDASINGRTPTQGTFSAKKVHVAPLINFESPPKPKPKPPNLSTKAPPLPPRKPSFTSLKSVASSSSLVSYNETPQTSHRSDSLTVDHIHTYPPLKIDLDSRSRNGTGHVAGSSISSFHSVSLSSDTDPSTPGSVANFIATYPIDQNADRDFSGRSNGSEADSISLGESYEEVSTTSLASPATERMIALDFEKMAKRKPIPPKLPQRPASTQSATFGGGALKSPPLYPPHRPASTPGSSAFRISTSSTSSTSTLANVTRRAPPPPPTSRSSDRSSIQSTTTSHSASSTSTNSHYAHLNTLNIKTRRPTPVPPAARRRYERVFNANILQRRKFERQRAKEKPALLSPTEARRTRQAAGWRGLSVDLITGGDVGSPAATDDENEYDGVVGTEERLEGYIIKSIWRRSKLDSARLAEIWSECDPSNIGVLDCDGFVKGMWRIDEELRRAQIQTLKSASASSLGSLRGKGKSKPPPVSRSKPILH